MDEGRKSRGPYFYSVALAVLLVWAPLHEGGATHLGWTVSRLLLAAVVSAALWRSFGSGVVEFTRSSLMLCWTALAALLAVETFRAQYAYTARQWFMSYAAMAAAFFLAAHIGRFGRRAWARYALVIIGLMESLWAVGQYLWGESLRSHGSFFNPSFLGGYLAAVSAIPLARVVFSGRRDWAESIIGPCFALAWFLLVAGVLVSGSRGAVVALLVGMTVVGWSRVGIKISPVIIAAVFLILAVPNPFRSRLMNLNRTDIYAWSRLGMWRSSMEMIADYPAGIGTGMFRYYSPRYAFPVRKAYARYGKVAQKAHNSYLDIACELSPPAALLVIGMAGCLMLAGTGMARRVGSAELAGWAGMLAAVMAHAAGDSVHKSPPIAFVGAASAGIIWAMKSKKLPTVKLRAPPWSRWAVPVAGLLIAWWIISPAAAYWVSRKAVKAGVKDAGKLLRVATILAPDNATYWYDRATFEKSLWERDKDRVHIEHSLKYMEYAMELNPLDAKYPAALGGFLSIVGAKTEGGKKLLETAVDYYNRAEKLAPKNPFYCERRGRLLVRLERRGEAVNAFQRAVDIEPNYLKARLELADTLAREGKSSQAAEQYRILLEKIKERPIKLKSDYEMELGRLNDEAARREAMEFLEGVNPPAYSTEQNP